MWQITNANTAVGLITIGLSFTKLKKNYTAHYIKRGRVMKTDEFVCPWCMDNTKSCGACDDSYEGE